jgi:hypothetical protein
MCLVALVRSNQATKCTVIIILGVICDVQLHIVAASLGADPESYSLSWLRGGSEQGFELLETFF